MFKFGSLLGSQVTGGDVQVCDHCCSGSQVTGGDVQIRSLLGSQVTGGDVQFNHAWVTGNRRKCTV